MKKISSIVVAVLAVVLLCCLGMITENVDASKIVAKQAVFSGEMTYWTEPGVKAQWFGNITEYDKSVQLWFSDDDSEGSDKDTPIRIQFNDGGTAMLSGSVRVELPTNPEQLHKIHTKFRTMDRLMNELIRPTIRKAVPASGPMMTAYESYSEKRNGLLRYIDDQISNGIYQTVLKEEKVIDEISGDEKVVRVAYPVADPRAINGIARQELPPFQEFGIKVVQIALNDYSYDDVVKGQIVRQQKIMMDMKTSYADALKARQDAIKEEEMGKARAAKAKWDQEEIKATAVTKAEQEREVSKLAAEKAEFDKKKVISEGQAAAEANRLKVAAGLTPQERAEWDYKTTVGVAEALAKSEQKWVPEIMIVGEGKASNGANPLDAVGLKMLMDVTKNMSK